jgi:hypothetical protein
VGRKSTRSGHLDDHANRSHPAHCESPVLRGQKPSFVLVDGRAQ